MTTPNHLVTGGKDGNGPETAPAPNGATGRCFVDGREAKVALWANDPKLGRTPCECGCALTDVTWVVAR